MPDIVVAGASLVCSFGTAPSTLAVLPPRLQTVGSVPAANVQDHKPMANIPPFVMCNAPTNPQVIANTAAALGTPTPAPCVPSVNAPWAPGATFAKIAGQPALTSVCTATCAWAGVITITFSGQTRLVTAS
jgi:Domain of unknown function (DUF4280)